MSLFDLSYFIIGIWFAFWMAAKLDLSFRDLRKFDVLIFFLLIVVIWPIALLVILGGSE